MDNLAFMTVAEKYLTGAKECAEQTRRAELIHPSRALVLADYVHRLVLMVESARLGFRWALNECNDATQTSAESAGKMEIAIISALADLENLAAEAGS